MSDRNPTPTDAPTHETLAARPDTADADRLVSKLLTDDLQSWTSTEAAEMCAHFNLADGRATSLRDARMAAQDIRTEVSDR